MYPGAYAAKWLSPQGKATLKGFCQATHTPVPL
jgi:hypothetical protein